MKNMKTKGWRDFLKESVLADTPLLVMPSLLQASPDGMEYLVAIPVDDVIGLIVPKSNGLKIIGTFLDEISHDIPHQNFPLVKFNKPYMKFELVSIQVMTKALRLGSLIL